MLGSPIHWLAFGVTRYLFVVYLMHCSHMRPDRPLVFIKAFVPRRRQTAYTKDLPVRGLCCAFFGGPRLSLVRPGVWF